MEIRPPKLDLFYCTFNQAMDVVCDHALRQCEPEPESVGVYIFTDQADLTLFALQFRGRLRMADNAALVFPTERDEVDAFVMYYGIYERLQCAELCGVWFWDTEDEQQFRSAMATLTHLASAPIRDLRRRSFPPFDVADPAEALGEFGATGRVVGGDHRIIAMPVESEPTADAVARRARETLPLATASLRPEHYYGSLPLCVIDAVFSIRANYERTTKKVVRRWAEAQDPAWNIDRRLPSHEHSVSEFLHAVGDTAPDALAKGVFRNRGRTSTRNGILKAEAVIKFSKALAQAGVQKLADISDPAKVEVAEALVRNIPGQKSGITFSYFLLLAGSDDEVKPDTMICRFVSDAMGGAPIKAASAKSAVIAAAKLLRSEYPDITPRLLDALIWEYESRKAAAKPRTRTGS